MNKKERRLLDMQGAFGLAVLTGINNKEKAVKEIKACFTKFKATLEERQELFDEIKPTLFARAAADQARALCDAIQPVVLGEETKSEPKIETPAGNLVDSLEELHKELEEEELAKTESAPTRSHRPFRHPAIAGPSTHNLPDSIETSEGTLICIATKGAQLVQSYVGIVDDMEPKEIQKVFQKCLIDNGLDATILYAKESKLTKVKKAFVAKMSELL